VHGGRIEGDLGHRLGREVRELEFLDRPVPVQREADGIAGACALGQGRVEDPRAPEFPVEVLGHLERAPVGRDVLPEDDRLGSLGENLANTGVERLGHGQVLGDRRLRFPREGRGHRRENGRLQPLGARAGHRDRARDAFLNEFSQLVLQRDNAGRADTRHQRFPKRGKRVRGQESLGLAGPQVVAGVVGGMSPEPERPHLDQHRPRCRSHPVDDVTELPGGFAGIPELDREALHPVACGPSPQLGARDELLVERRGIRVPVVLYDEDNRKRHERREVHRLMHVAGARGAVPKERETHRLAPKSALRVGGPEDRAAHGPEVADHRKRSVGRIAIVDVSLARARGALRVCEVLVQVLAEVAAPDQLSSEVAVGERDDVSPLVRQQGQRDDHPLVALAPGDRAPDQSLSKKVQDAVVGDPGQMHPGIDQKERLVRVLFQVRGAQVARL